MESVQAQEREPRSINIFDKSNRSTIRREVPVQQTESEDLNRVSASLRRAFDPEAGQQSRLLLHYGIFLGIVAVMAGGFFVWKIWRQHRLVREMTDPAFLLSELNAVHRLSEQEKRLLQELAEQFSLASPLNLFVEPKFLLDAWNSETFSSSQPTIRQLLSKLFDIAKA